ncbi:MAG: substrate-binding domain-containing protein [Verrucomicrobiota bacterium]
MPLGDNPDLPVQRHLLTEQVLAHLRAGIASGCWGKLLPTERNLAASLHVSRSTLRVALKALRHEGSIESVRALGNKITARVGRTPAAPITHTVGLLAPGPLHLHAPFANAWLDHLRSELHDYGMGIVVHENSHVYTQTRRSTALEQLVTRNRHDFWVPVLSTPVMQSWFARSGLPCVLAGSPHRGIELPSVDVDFFAACRHAAVTLLQLGHRHILYIDEQSRARGYSLSEAGFSKGVAEYGDPDIEITVRRVRPEDRLTAAQIQPIWRRQHPPTAVLVMTAGRCLGIHGCLAQLGLRVPGDVSLLCRSSGTFFEHMVPTPAHYEFSPDEYAALLAHHVLAKFKGSPPGDQAHQLMPKFVRGESLGRAPERK